MKTEVTLRVRGIIEVHTVDAPNPSSGGAIAMQRLSPRIDRMREVQIINCVGHCGFTAGQRTGGYTNKHTTV